MAISKVKRDKIVQQALQEIAFARSYKQGKIANWAKNENMYYGKKTPTTESRATENTRLRRAVSDLTLEKLILKEAASGNF